MHPRAFLLLLAPLFFFCGGCAANASLQASGDSLLLLGGKIDVDNRFAGTVIVTPDGPFGMCSGLLIAPRLVLTAGHCVCARQKAPKPQGQADLVINAGSCAATASVTTVFYESSKSRGARREPAGPGCWSRSSAPETRLRRVRLVSRRLPTADTAARAPCSSRGRSLQSRHSAGHPGAPLHRLS